MLNIGVNAHLHICPCVCLGPCVDAPPPSSAVTADNTVRTADTTTLTADNDATI